MTDVFMTDPATGRCALFEEPTASGDVRNPNSPRNAPLNSPAANLPFIYFHSDFNYLEVSHGPLAVTVEHPSIGVPSFPPNAAIQYGWVSAAADTGLLTHNLGYAPLALVARGNQIVWPGMPVQVTSDGGMRFVSVYSTSTQIRLFESASVGVSALPAIDLSYTLLVFRDPPAGSGNILFDFDPDTGVVQMGRGKFNSSFRYLQVAPGGSPFSIAYGGRTIDLTNGAPRAIRPDGSDFNPVPSGLRLALPRIDMRGTDWGTSFGASMAYDAGFSGPATTIAVQAP